MSNNNQDGSGSSIRAMRIEMGVSSYELARRAGVAQPTVINWEKREQAGTITLGSLRRASEALGRELVYGLVLRKRSGPEIKGDTGDLETSSPEPVDTVPEYNSSRSIDPNSIWGG